MLDHLLHSLAIHMNWSLKVLGYIYITDATLTIFAIVFAIVRARMCENLEMNIKTSCWGRQGQSCDITFPGPGTERYSSVYPHLLYVRSLAAEGAQYPN